MSELTVVPATHISEEMKAAIGQEMGRQVSFPVSMSDIRRWALAVYYPEQPPAEFIDERAAAAGPYGGIVAPQEFNPFAWLAAESETKGADLDQNDPDRPERTLGIAGPGLAFMLNGGMDVEYGALMRPGDVIISVSRLGNYTERSGRLGLMLFTVFEDTWTNQNGELVKRTNNTLIRY
jgi:hypothetical protein